MFDKYKNMSKQEWWAVIKNFLYVIIGTSILGFGVGVFVLPFELITGGVPGLSIILFNIIPGEAISLEMYTTIITWVLFFIGWIFLGKDFALKTLTSTIVYPIAVGLTSLLVSPDVLGGFFDLKTLLNPITGEVFEELPLIVAAVFGGAFVGAGCAITFLGGGSTGGVDIISLILNKYCKSIRESTSMFVIDGTLVILGMFIMNNLILTLLGVTSAFVCALVVDHIFLGASKEFVAHIITDKYDEITKAVHEEIDRTTTLVDVVGGYSREPKKLVIISFTMNQYSKLSALINKIDKDAFMTIHRAHEINGKGFSDKKETK